MFDRMVEGYQRRGREQAIFFREQYSLFYNVNRDPKSPALLPHEVWLLPGEKKPRKSKESSGGGYTIEQMAEAARKASLSPTPPLTPWQEQ